MGDVNSNPLNNADDSRYNQMKSSLPPVWVEKLEMAEDDMKKIQEKMRELQQLHTRRLMVTFDADESRQEREIEYVTQEITGIFRHAEGVLTNIEKMVNTGVAQSGAEITVRRNMQAAIARKLQNISLEFRGQQKTYMTKVKNQKAGNDAFNFLDEKKPQAGAGGGAAGMTGDVDNGFTAQQLLALEQTETLVQERDAEIIKIAKSVEEMATIFRQLSTMIYEQGTILDRIDHNMENAVADVQAGMVHLEKAEESQKSAIPTRCIIALVVLIAILLIILIIKHSSKKWGK